LPVFRARVEPIDGPINGPMAKAPQLVVMALDPKRYLAGPICFQPDCSDARPAMIQRRFDAFPETEVGFKQTGEDQCEITLGFRRELNSKLDGCGSDR
jgi:hypothetical protein